MSRVRRIFLKFCRENICHWIILSQPYSGGMRMKLCSPTNCSCPWDNILLTVNKSKFIARIYGFSGPTVICLSEFSNHNSRTKCKICSKLTMLVSLLLFLNIFDMLFRCFYCWLWTCNCRKEYNQWNPNSREKQYYWTLNLSIHFRVGYSSQSPLRWGFL